MKLKNYSLILFVALCCTFTSCDPVNHVIGLISCKYDLDGVSNPMVGGVRLNNITNISQINALSMVKLAASIAQGSLPLSATVNVKATNPGRTLAQIEKLEWAIDLENKEILQGVVNQQINIPANGGSTTIPFTLQLDLLKLINDGSQNDLLNLALNLVNAGDADSKIGIRVKPTIMVGGRPVSMGFINISKAVKSN
jgi:LEA14-like dessication related protein